ncbi:hypothetical protein A4A49_39017 [Nicotiana attenuata]|uniref:Uncharacterized protein n=1 Tax=Nicotiana attenuata TaxID=49451 RepID=A0A314KTY2_NICAT|nr:hypothetical protein A4A49_39017 [Nicotiana attenuata]
MAKNHSNTKLESQSQGSYRKIFKAFKRRFSSARPLTQSPVSTTKKADAKPSTAIASASNNVLIEYNHKPKPMFKSENKPGRVNNMAANFQQNQGPKGVKFQAGYNNITTTASNEKFNDFIDHVKNKIKATSTFVVADENDDTTARVKRTTTRRDSFNDRVSHFINRAKLKMRTTTIVGGSGGGGGDNGDGKLQPFVPR